MAAYHVAKGIIATWVTVCKIGAGAGQILAKIYTIIHIFLPLHYTTGVFVPF